MRGLRACYLPIVKPVVPTHVLPTHVLPTHGSVYNLCVSQLDFLDWTTVRTKWDIYTNGGSPISWPKKRLFPSSINAHNKILFHHTTLHNSKFFGRWVYKPSGADLESMWRLSVGVSLLDPPSINTHTQLHVGYVCWLTLLRDATCWLKSNCIWYSVKIHMQKITRICAHAICTACLTVKLSCTTATGKLHAGCDFHFCRNFTTTCVSLNYAGVGMQQDLQ